MAVLQGLRTHDVAAGATLAEYERALHRRAPAATADADGRLRLHGASSPPEWIDYNGHAHESRYLQVVGDTTDAMLRRPRARRSTAGDSYFTVETHLSHLGQARAGDRLHVTTQLLGHDEKRLHVFHAVPAPTTTRCSRPPSRCSCTSTRRRGARRRRRRAGTAGRGAGGVARRAAASRARGARGQRARALLAGAACANSRASARNAALGSQCQRGVARSGVAQIGLTMP